MQIDAALPDGWEAAQQLHRLKKTLAGSRQLDAVTERALDAIVQRARSLLRHAASPTRVVHDTWPAEGDLDLDATLEQPRRIPTDGRRAPWDEVVVTRREPRDADVVAILDMSLSMTGEKIALLAVAAAILQLKLENVSVVAFDTTAHTLVRLRERVPIRELVRRILMVPAQGYTHVAAGLETGLGELRASGRRERVGLLLSDGIANVGDDPVHVAGRFPCLHVVQLGHDLPQGTRACRAMARAGRGRRFHAPTYMALPDVVKRVIREVFRV
ncbi:MAG: VWA domain-containing protein [Proteobacteria bacterium]|nr:VWA domain-containing protein [Pseudomonadota bacterium]MCP4920383.1 VWA domain-containing protein [Pseudomonadota bacterium]